MFFRIAYVVTRWWRSVIAVWIIAAAGLALLAPSWQSVTLDGDFAYLPAWMPSVVGQRWLENAFPQQHGKSQIVVAIARPHGDWSTADYAVAYDLARRMKNLLGAARITDARRLAGRQRLAEQAGYLEDARDLRQRRVAAEREAEAALADAIRLDQLLAGYWEKQAPAHPQLLARPTRQLAEAYHNRALLEDQLGHVDNAKKYHQIATDLAPRLRTNRTGVLPAAAERLPLLDVWTWRDSYFGDKLTSRDEHARLIVLQLTNEFMAVDNIHVLNTIEAQLAAVKATWPNSAENGLQVVETGSAAVGADLLRSAAASIRDTERITILLVVLILACVYRSPLLVVIPLATIGVALTVSTSLVALLAQLSGTARFQWLGVTVFTTTRIFIVVILFGAGTDYCLFLIARYKEELTRGMSSAAAIARALGHVGDALAASALTTILGLAMMYFADFGKYHHSGPVIGLCLFVTLLTCVTFTPALLLAMGHWLFWPFALGNGVKKPARWRRTGRTLRDRNESWTNWVWSRIARLIVTRPGLILVVAVVGLLPLAGVGAVRGRYVTFDFLSSLPNACPSKRGAALLRQYFPVGESGPVTVLVRHPGEEPNPQEVREQVRLLADLLHIEGVVAVRSAEDPLGLLEPGEKVGLLSSRARRIRVLRAHPRTKAIFIAQAPDLASTVSRFDVVMQYDPFSIDAVRCVDRINQRLERVVHDAGSLWYKSTFAMTGITAGIRDLRYITRQDNLRIQILVVGAVLIVLVITLRRLLVCVYMMASVLFSYYVTLGITQLFFAWQLGADYHGLDWKTPLFLFVILVAVGQDYNVYLATRVFEEQSRLGPFAGLRRAVICTGGIITSCGVIMAGTFFAMTGSAWTSWIPGIHWHAPTDFGPLQSIVQLGFALALGVLLDTFIVRPILLPAFLALLAHYQGNRGRVA